MMLSRRETKAERTHNEALAVIDSERAAREKKTGRLRALRIAEEAKTRPSLAEEPPRRGRRKGMNGCARSKGPQAVDQFEIQSLK